MLDGLKVVHAPLEIAGQVGMICQFLKKYNVEAVGYNYFPNYLKYTNVIDTDSYELAKIVEDLIKHYDLFHFHNGYTFFEDFRDIEVIREHDKPIIMHHRGNDVRSRKRSRAWNGYENPYVNAESSLPDEEIDRNLRYFASRVTAAIVQDHELLSYVEDYYAAEGKKVYILPRLFDVHRRQPVYVKKETADRKILIVHAPTQRDFKGTEYINQAMEKLQAELPVRYQLVEHMPHADAWNMYEQADIIIDQVLCGAYGNLSVEGMALGKPVVCYIRPDLMDKYPPDLPIVSANPDTIYDEVKTLVQDPERRYQLGRKGRAYVEDYHSAESVIKQLLTIYQEVLEPGKGAAQG